MTDLGLPETRRVLIERELKSLYDQHGFLTGDLVYTTAKDETHPLHDVVFDVGPEEASDRYYRLRARAVVRLVKVRAMTDGERVVTLRRYPSVLTSSGSRAYMDVDDVKADPATRELRRRELLRELQALQRRYADEQEFFASVVREALAADG